MSPQKIDIVVHGRFHAFDLAKALLSLGHDVLVYTNYPKFAAERFGLPGCRVRSFYWHALIARTLAKLDTSRWTFESERYLHQLFGAWAADHVRQNADLMYVFSGVAEEILLLPREAYPGEKWVVRGSSHIREQSQLLCDEEARCGVRIEKPSTWRIEREEREYELADKIVVLSSFAQRSFVRSPTDPSRLVLLRLGVATDSFRPNPKVIDARCARILSGQPLRVLTVGSFTARKGGHDLATVAATVAPTSRFQFVGELSREFRELRVSNSYCVDFCSRVPQEDLARIYEAADVFLFPTIEDGSAVVLNQAQAAGLPILTTTNCSGPDLVREGATGWIVPIRSPDALVDRLRWCHNHRSELAAMVRSSYNGFVPRDWKDAAADLIHALSRSDRCGPGL